MTIKILPNEKETRPGSWRTRAALRDGPLEGLKLIGFSVWERKTGGGRNVTFPARQCSVNGERRSFSAAAAARRRHGAGSRRGAAGVWRIRSCGGGERLNDRRRVLEDRKEPGVLFLPLGRKRPLFTQRLLELGLEECRLHAAIDNVPGQQGSAERSRKM